MAGLGYHSNQGLMLVFIFIYGYQAIKATYINCPVNEYDVMSARVCNVYSLRKV